VESCAVCQEDIEPKSVCPRCGSDNAGVKDLTFGYFSSIWAFLSFLLIFAPLFMLLPGIFAWMDRILQPMVSLQVAGPISLLITLIIAFFLFSMREELHEKSLTREFKEKPSQPLTVWALTCFLLAVVFTFLLGFVITTKQSIVDMGQGSGLEYGGSLHLFFKLVMTGCLVLLFAFFSLSSGLMAIYEYGQLVDKESLAPIYLNEEKLLTVVLNFVQGKLGPEVKLELAQMKRLPDAGISVTLQQEGELRTEKSGNEEIRLLERKGWSVEANRWGRVRKMDESSPSKIQIKDAPKPSSASKAQGEPLTRVSTGGQAASVAQLTSGS